MVNLWRAIRFTVVFAILLGALYPLAVSGIGNLLFPYQAKGSMVQLNGQTVGSKLIAQQVTAPGLFHPRPSAVDYAANGSGGSNLGPTNPALVKEVQQNLQVVEKQDPGTPPSKIPPDMVESSASGLDPDISVQDALIQIPRIAKATGLSQAYLKSIVNGNAQGPALGIWGNTVVNVMQLNVAIEQRLRK
ncbi:potassium-transporting ATPase subunit KdpC [Alicyclobacillus acidiphilus]|uniref:potassium-transporting ATPase subunit KdpC n=1 Tax=Alicyclobacillus acidiphilus TaxID=182455 RepID=UPI000830FE49|nr:potassium-transporting ATPase subunit KdpC [Alicyclobacillus acidiphilus]